MEPTSLWLLLGVLIASIIYCFHGADLFMVGQDRPDSDDLVLLVTQGAVPHVHLHTSHQSNAIGRRPPPPLPPAPRPPPVSLSPCFPSCPTTPPSHTRRE